MYVRGDGHFLPCYFFRFHGQLRPSSVKIKLLSMQVTSFGQTF